MTAPLPGSAAATSPDLHEHAQPLPAATWSHLLTSAVAGSAYSGRSAGAGLSGVCGVALAATATRPHLSGLGVVVVLVVLAAVWAVRVWLWPFARCPRCEGSGRNIGSNGKRWGTCRRCKGTGRRQRLGARLIHRIIVRKEVK